MIEHQSLTSLVASTIQGGTAPNLLAAIESELLQLRLLRSLDDAGLLDGLVLHGGAAVRFCYGGSRFSDALSFAGGADFTLQRFLHIKQCLEADLGIQCELSIADEEATTPYKEAESAVSQVGNWALTIATPTGQGIPQQTARLHVLRATTHTAQAMPIQLEYDWLPVGYSDTVVMVESKHEMLASILASLPSAIGHTRYKSLWDLAWLMRVGTGVFQVSCHLFCVTQPVLFQLLLQGSGSRRQRAGSHAPGVSPSVWGWPAWPLQAPPGGGPARHCPGPGGAAAA